MSKVYFLLPGILLCACANRPFMIGAPSKPDTPQLLPLSYKAADHLHGQLSGSEVAGYPMLAAAFVDSANVLFHCASMCFGQKFFFIHLV